MKTAGRLLGLGLLLLAVGFSSVSGQSRTQTDGKQYLSEIGSLNLWTTDTVYRQKLGHIPEFLTVRFGKHRGFDRMVFEVKGI
jgi:hypothetical protein